MNNREFLFKLAAESPAKLAEWFDDEHEYQTSVGCDACLYKKQYDDLEAECEETARLLSECTIKRVSAEHELGDTLEQVAELKRKGENIETERDNWRNKCGRMMDMAHEITRIGEL